MASNLGAISENGWGVEGYLFNSSQTQVTPETVKNEDRAAYVVATAVNQPDEDSFNPNNYYYKASKESESGSSLDDMGTMN